MVSACLSFVDLCSVRVPRVTFPWEPFYSNVCGTLHHVTNSVVMLSHVMLIGAS